MANPWQPYQNWVTTKRTATSKTKKARDKRVRRGGKVRMVNAPKGW